MSLGTSGKYRLDHRLGGGGMAEVFAGSMAGAEGFSRRIAIKRVRPEYSDNPRFAQMFISEARLSAQLVHPNIVSVLDFDRGDDGQLFLVMELVDGKNLSALLATGRLPVPVVIFITAEILRGLGFAHHLPSSSELRGVVHRDVSPHNVLVSWEGAVKVSDFGIAKARAASEATASVSIKGKPAYMSPEQANSQPLDGRSDLFAVGVMLWEMLTAQRLFVGEDTRAVLASVLFKSIPRPRALCPDLARDVDRVAMRLLQRDLAARYPTAEAALADLVACADAPRDGREALVSALAERFAGEVPARHRTAPAPPPAARLPGAPTLTQAPDSGPLLPAVAEPTRTAIPTAPPSAPPREPRRALTALALVAASAAASFALVSRACAAWPAAPGSAERAADHPEDRAPTIDPGEVAAAAPQPDAAAVQSTDPAADGWSGTLRVIALPILRITIDGTPRGASPLTVALPAGDHRVRLHSAEHHIDQTVAVTIVAQQTFTIDRMPQ